MSGENTSSGLTYKAAGVDIDAGDALVERIKPLARRTTRPEVLGGLGGFGSLCEIPAGYRQPVLVSGTDGVGTKLKLAMQLGIHDTIGIDLVAMCVNDIVVTGAEPLFFLDYYATGRLSVETAARVVSGIAEGCVQAGCALVGGETAEMPGMYEGEDYDLAGFCVGVVEKSAIIDGSRVQPSDCLIGLASSGAHSNGYSLIRKILEVSGVSTDMPLAGTTLGQALLAPTRIYVKSLLSLIRQMDVKALAHITGGGLTENLPRVLPQGTQAMLSRSAWPRPDLFRWLQEAGRVPEDDLLRTFNCGIGMVVCVAESDAEKAKTLLTESGETCFDLGCIEAGSGEPAVHWQD